MTVTMVSPRRRGLPLASAAASSQATTLPNRWLFATSLLGALFVGCLLSGWRILAPEATEISLWLRNCGPEFERYAPTLTANGALTVDDLRLVAKDPVIYAELLASLVASEGTAVAKAKARHALKDKVEALLAKVPAPAPAPPPAPMAPAPQLKGGWLSLSSWLGLGGKTGASQRGAGGGSASGPAHAPVLDRAPVPAPAPAPAHPPGPAPEGTGRLLWVAAMYWQVDQVQALCEKWGGDEQVINWANPDRDGQTPLYMARDSPQMTAILLSTPGCDVNKGTNSGRTPLWWAASNCCPETVQALLAAPGIDLNKAPTEGGECCEGKSPLTMAREGAAWEERKSCQEVVRLLEGAGAR